MRTLKDPAVFLAQFAGDEAANRRMLGLAQGRTA